MLSRLISLTFHRILLGWPVAPCHTLLYSRFLSQRIPLTTSLFISWMTCDIMATMKRVVLPAYSSSVEWAYHSTRYQGAVQFQQRKRWQAPIRKRPFLICHTPEHDGAQILVQDLRYNLIQKWWFEIVHAFFESFLLEWPRPSTSPVVSHISSSLGEGNTKISSQEWRCRNPETLCYSCMDRAYVGDLWKRHDVPVKRQIVSPTLALWMYESLSVCHVHSYLTDDDQSAKLQELCFAEWNDLRAAASWPCLITAVSSSQTIVSNCSDCTCSQEKNQWQQNVGSKSSSGPMRMVTHGRGSCIVQHQRMTTALLKLCGDT